MQENVGSNHGVFGGKKVLVMGLGLHGGGAATVKWLIGEGASVTVTDMRDAKTLAPSLALLKNLPVRYVLGGHRLKDFRSHDIIVVNPGVPRESVYLRAAIRAGKRIENVASLFFSMLKNPVIGVTGTRGKTTTTLWVAELLRKNYRNVRASGSPENALLDEFERIKGKNAPVACELSSWQLEYLPVARSSPVIAIITNVYPDHQNRYRNMRDYADAKANIFRHQKASGAIILNRDNRWHKYFLRKKPKGGVFFISKGPLPAGLNGLSVKDGVMSLTVKGRTRMLFSVKRFLSERGEHNLENLLCAVLAVKLYAPGLKITERDVLRLPTPRMRQEIIVKNRDLTVVNDSCATSPDGTEASLERFGKEGNVILIAGGTDKKLKFSGLAGKIKKYISDERLVLLSGSATKKLVDDLRRKGYRPSPPLASLRECVRNALDIAKRSKGKTIVLFSPGAASFEKFLHEFDRGEQFNKLIVASRLVKP